MKLEFTHEVTENGETKKFYREVGCNTNNPWIVIKTYQGLVLNRFQIFDEEGDSIHDFVYTSGSWSRMTDRVTNRNCKPKNICKFAGIQLIDKKV